MDGTDVDLPRAGKQVREVISKDFHEHFMDAYAFATEMTAATALNANEDIHVAMDHMSRALETSDEELIAKEISGARTKIASATIECLSMAIIGVDGRIRTMVGLIEASGQELLEKIRASIKKLEALQKDAKAAIKKDMPDSVSKLNYLLQKARECEEEIELMYPDIRGLESLKLRKIFALSWKAVLGIVIAFGADVAFNVFARVWGG